MRWHHKRIGNHIMFQWSRAIGPLTLGIHICIRNRYADIHLPYCIITVGQTWIIEYSRDYHASPRDPSVGVTYGNIDVEPDGDRD